MSVVNTGQVMLSKARVDEKLREVKALCASIEHNVKLADIHEVVAAAQFLYCASLELLEHCDDYARAIDPSFGVKL